ncbi:hypothetical protein CPLU01_07004 [Colletotrichum plurivorum]|uniref:Transmembrane protein n=1 Tax=Colletotrichum plurivorum TaxID=2175906 RepID=A0A8H6KHP5_9PEZI|nr:hypothetical protein CPLU01_07004 [Colletotrichum plurivorum]
MRVNSLAKQLIVSLSKQEGARGRSKPYDLATLVHKPPRNLSLLSQPTSPFASHIAWCFHTQLATFVRSNSTPACASLSTDESILLSLHPYILLPRPGFPSSVTFFFSFDGLEYLQLEASFVACEIVLPRFEEVPSSPFFKTDTLGGLNTPSGFSIAWSSRAVVTALGQDDVLFINRSTADSVSLSTEITENLYKTALFINSSEHQHATVPFVNFEIFSGLRRFTSRSTNRLLRFHPRSSVTTQAATMDSSDAKFPERNDHPYVVFHTNTETKHPAQPTPTDWQTGGMVPNRVDDTSRLQTVGKTTVVATKTGRNTLDTVITKPTAEASATPSVITKPDSQGSVIGLTNPLMWKILAVAVGSFLFLLILLKIYRAIRRRHQSIEANEERLQEQHRQRVMTNMIYNNSWTSRSSETFNVVRADRNSQANDDNGLAELPGDLPGDRSTDLNVGRTRRHTNAI